jgi:hypothetical protein
MQYRPPRPAPAHPDFDLSEMRTTTTFLILVLSIPCCAALAQDATPKSTIAIVGDAERFTIGQGGFCENRTDIGSPSGKKFRIPSNKESFFYIQSKIRGQVATYTCEGDFSFMPSPGLLHIIRLPSRMILAG